MAFSGTGFEGAGFLGRGRLLGMGFFERGFLRRRAFATPGACEDGEEERSARGGRKEVQEVRSYASNASLLRLAATGNCEKGLQ